MAHLKKGADGHLLKNAAGHLVKDCPDSDCGSCCNCVSWTMNVKITGGGVDWPIDGRDFTFGPADIESPPAHGDCGWRKYSYNSPVVGFDFDDSTCFLSVGISSLQVATFIDDSAQGWFMPLGEPIGIAATDTDCEQTISAWVWTWHKFGEPEITCAVVISLTCTDWGP